MENKTIKERVIEKIKRKEVKMKPKLHFVLKTLFYALGIIFVLSFLIFLLSFIIFRIRMSGLWYFPAFGFRGWGLFFASFPWFLVIFAIILVIILEIAAKRFSLVYRRPLVYSIIGIMIIVLLIGFAISRTSMHPLLFQGVKEGKVPIMGPLYRRGSIEGPADTFIAKVLEISDKELKIEERRKGEVLRVIISPKTRFPFGRETKEGDLIMIIGKRGDSVIEAFGLRRIGGDKMFFPRPLGR